MFHSASIHRPASVSTMGTLERPISGEVCRPGWDVKWINSRSELLQLARKLAREPILSIDTETADWETPDKEHLCLVQIGVPSKGITYIVDMMAFTRGNPHLEQAALQPLRSILENDWPRKVIQYAPFEQGQFARSKIVLNGVHDTKQMGIELGRPYGSRGLKDLCEYYLDLRIGKEQQKSQWGKRPLTEVQLNYAALDVELAFAVYMKMRSELMKKGVCLDTLDWRDRPHH